MKDRVNELDFLRVTAIAAVLLYHYTFRGYAGDDMSVVPFPELVPVTKYGYLGVHLFFMVSGFVILMTATAGGIRKFIASRCARLYPAMWACCTLTYAATVAMGGERFSAAFGQYIANLSIVSMFFDVVPIDGAYWSLGPEIEFYGTIGLIVAAGQISRAEFFFQLALAALGLATILSWQTSNILLLIDYFPYFSAGAFYYLIWAKGPSFGRWLGVAVSWTLTLHQCISFVPYLSSHYRTDMSITATAAIVTSYFAIFAAIATRSTTRFGAMRWVSAGAITYPLYLLHENIGFMLFNALYPEVNRFILLACTTALMVSVAYCVHVIVERTLASRVRGAVLYLLSPGRWRTPRS